MIRPPNDVAVSAFFARPEDGGLDVEKWSALIGIITAIVGNILISFALNLQRYAHILLGRERAQRSTAGRSGFSGGGKGKGQSAGIPDYGTQEDLAEERARRNREAPALDEEDEMHRAVYHHSGNEEEHAQRNGKTQPASSSDAASPSDEKDEDGETTTYLRSPYWWAGILLMTLGETGNFLAYGFAPASIVSPLGVVALVSNCIVAPCLLKERFRQRDFWGVLVAVAGAVTVVLSAKEGETKMGPQEVWQAITRWEFELYLGITLAMILALSWASDRYGERTVMIDLGLVGLYGGFTALSTKGIASMISDTLFRALTFPITYLLGFILVATAFMQIRYTNRALQRFDSTQVIPTQFVCFTIAVIVGSAVLYRDFESATVDRVGKFIGGCVLTFSGVYLITSGRPDGNDGGDDLDLDEEQAIGLIDEEAEQQRAEDDCHDSRTTPVDQRTSLKGTRTSDGASQLGSRSSTHTLSSTAPPRHRLESTTSSSASLNTTTTPTTTAAAAAAVSQSLAQPRHALSSTASTPLLPSARPTRPLTGSRASMAMVLAGPLSSPLSSSLSAVVADRLRRGVASPSRPSAQRLRNSSSQSNSIGIYTSSKQQQRLRLDGGGGRARGEGGSMASRAGSVGSSLRGLFRLRSSRGSRSVAAEEREGEDDENEGGRGESSGRR